MRLVLWGVLIVALCYAAYSGMLAFSAWMKVNSAVDEIVSREGVESVPSRELKSRVMAAANEAGVPITERDVTVTNDGRVTIEVMWTIPVVVANGESVVAVPLSVKRTSAGAARR
jgi:hypothetical protein